LPVFIGHHKLVINAFFVMACIEIFAVVSAFMYKRCNIEWEIADGGMRSTMEMGRGTSVTDYMKVSTA